MDAKYRTQDRYEHGVRARYSAGCRCADCREANRNYERGRLAARRDGDFNGTVSARAARKYLHTLSAAGIGRRSIERITGISRSVIVAIKSGAKTRIRARTEKLILSVTEMYTRGPIPGDFGYCELCRKEKKHLCLATSKVDGIAKCDGCRLGHHCNWCLGKGTGDGTKGRPHDLPSAKKLARKHPHGHKMCYLAGCRCSKCKQANRKYENAIIERRKVLGPNDLVSTDQVKAHLHWLQTYGIGHQTVSKITGVGKTGLSKILWSGKKLMRRRAANAVLTVKPCLENFPKNKPIPAKETVAKIRQLMKWGIPRRFISRDGIANSFGLQIPSLKWRSSFVIVRTALDIRDYFARVEKMRAIWIGLGRKIPPRHYVYWKPRRHGMTVRSFELRPFATTYDYNLYPQELRDTIQALGKLKHQIRTKGERHGKKQNI